MPETHQEIKDRLLKTASALWGYKETQAETHFDPLVGILLGACATELKKIAHDIEDTRTRVLERLVQLLNPEVLSGALPAHAVAYASPADKQAALHNEIQFYTTKKTTGGEEHNNTKTLFFSATGPFTICRAHITAMVTTQKVYAVKDTLKKETLLHSNAPQVHPYQHSIWLGVEQAAALPAEAVFFFELRNEARRGQFYHSLPEAKWQGMENAAAAQKGFGSRIPLHGKPNPEGIVNGQTSATSRITQHINTLYAPQFITVTDLATAKTSAAWPEELGGIYAADEIKKLAPEYFSWVRIDFPEQVNIEELADELYISLNCFPVANLQLITAQHKLMEYTNIIPLTSEGFFTDLTEVTDMEGRSLGAVYDTGGSSQVQLHYGGVERFNERDALFAVEGMIQQLRDESSAYNSLGNEFMNTELKTLQQSLNKLEQEISDRQAMKSNTPYLVINGREKTTTGNIYIKYRATNGALGNNIKAGTPLQLYKGPDIQGNAAKLVTPALGGRNSLSSRDKVLAYKTALLSKEKLVTEEDIAGFCRLRMALAQAQIKVQKGYLVNNAIAGGFSKTMDVHIQLTPAEMRKLTETGPVHYWQTDLAQSITANANLLMPLRVFITQQEP